MKNIKWTSLVLSVCYIGSGAYFLANPYLAQEDLCTLIGYVLILLGIYNVLTYLIRKVETSFLRSDFTFGLIEITIGSIALAYKPLFIELVYIIMGITIMISGYNKLQDCVDTYRLGAKHGVLYLVLSIISIGIGLLVITNPFLDTVTVHYVIGAGLVYSGLSDLFSSVYLSSKMIKRKIDEKKAIEKIEEEVDQEFLEASKEEQASEDNADKQ